ncbi:hypothetical protein MM213_16550 [Belliella sp. R4-6]|uniref:Uncharacterized protein n=1 Tax=Belliella alkalica TaxID=1730871 RepID=A0ABS9VF98_9BACT|nr:hypothetical protein [Belliella alkalica]MCH7415113.1 hypothetical protein [Belliella alkalica]
MKSKILFSLLVGAMVLLWNPLRSSAGGSCANARCHSAGMGYCLEGHAISIRKSCDTLNCIFGIHSECGSDDTVSPEEGL